MDDPRFEKPKVHEGHEALNHLLPQEDEPQPDSDDLADKTEGNLDKLTKFLINNDPEAGVPDNQGEVPDVPDFQGRLPGDEKGFDQRPEGPSKKPGGGYDLDHLTRSLQE